MHVSLNLMSFFINQEYQKKKTLVQDRKINRSENLEDWGFYAILYGFAIVQSLYNSLG